MPSIIPFSYSSFDAYRTCPRMFYEQRISKKYPFVDTPATIWGKEVHSALENRANYGTDLPENMARFQPVADRIIYAPGDTYAEVKLAVDINLNAVDFWDKDAYARGVGDIVKINNNKALVGDWKTGKRKPASLQLDLMAVLTFSWFPEVEEITSCFVWFKEPSKPTSKKFKRGDEEKIMEQFESTVQDMQYSMEHNVWPEKPSGLCNGWCPVKECKHWRPKRRY